MLDNFLNALVPPKEEVKKLIIDQLNAENNGEKIASVEDNAKLKPLRPTVEDETNLEALDLKPSQPRPSQLKPSQPKTSPLKLIRGKARATTTLLADSNKQFVETSSTFRFVMEMRGKTNVLKRISRWKEAGRGGH